MKHLIVYIFLGFTATCCFKTIGAKAQGADSDSLWNVYANSKEETTRILALAYLCNELARYEPDSAIKLAQDGLKQAREISFPKGEASLTLALGVALTNVGDYANAIKRLLSTLAYADTVKDDITRYQAYNELTVAYKEQGDHREALDYSTKSIGSIDDNLHPPQSCFFCRGVCLLRATIYLELKELDSAKMYIDKAFSYPPTPMKAINASVFDIAGRIEAGMGHHQSALQLYRKGIQSFLELPQPYKGLPKIYNSIAMLWNNMGYKDSAHLYLRKSLIISKDKNFRKELSDAYLLLAEVYEHDKLDSALYYYKHAWTVRDILRDQEQQRQIASYKFDLELQEQQARNDQEQLRNQVKIYALIGVALFLSAVGVILWRNSDRRKKDLILITEQKAEADRQREKAEQSIKELKATQAQLIQSEKMASLGELTAGIAHEIQNPLNFVNNFSELNNELIDELKSEVVSGNRETVLRIAENIKSNQERINQHGKRADGIVKSMLQHSRSSSGQKELTDINALCDECLRLIYHGFRAKDKSFNAKANSNLDQTIPKAHVVPQDIGRALLNLISNAFYAVNEKAKVKTTEYVPTVTVATKLSNGKIEICVQDNGNGVPSVIKEKIFQPFFTTKPTGQGTGLGLSLAYDIVTKAHGGEIQVTTEHEEGTEFIIRLPV